MAWDAILVHNRGDILAVGDFFLGPGALCSAFEHHAAQYSKEEYYSRFTQTHMPSYQGTLFVAVMYSTLWIAATEEIVHLSHLATICSTILLKINLRECLRESGR